MFGNPNEIGRIFCDGSPHNPYGSSSPWPGGGCMGALGPSAPGPGTIHNRRPGGGVLGFPSPTSPDPYGWLASRHTWMDSRPPDPRKLAWS